jgi:hypothetical protein
MLLHDEIKKAESAEGYTMHDTEQKTTQKGFVREPEGETSLGRLSIDGEIILQ